jgi:sulfoquinovosidase
MRRIHVPLQDGEQVIGFGEQFVDLDQRGRAFDVWSDDLLSSGPRSTYWPAPLFFTSGGRGCIVDTTLPCHVVVAADAVTVEVPADDVEVVMLDGDLRSMVSRAVEVLGRPPRVPSWAFGVWINAGGGQDAVLDTARRIRDEQIPCSAVWVWDYYDDARNSGCRVAISDRFGEYPDLAAMNRALHGMGFRTLGYLNPCLPRDTGWHRRALGEGFAVRAAGGEAAHISYFHPWHQRQGEVVISPEAAALLDFTHPAGRSAWAENVRDMVDGAGWDGWMQDFGEQIGAGMRLADGSSGASAHNAYVAHYHAATADALGDRDVVWFVRAGSLGDQSRVPVLWPGDQRCDWTGERGIGSILSAGLSAGLMGVAAWGPDIPGFTDGDDGGTGDRELWLRWVQLGALTPVMRTHLGFKSPTPAPISIWTDERTVAAFRYWAALHVELQPYIVALAEEASGTGIPIMRPMAMEFPDFASWTECTQYMLGPSLLVAPVLHQGATSRTVDFPPGVWHDMWTGARVAGGEVLEVEAPPERIPLFLRDGERSPAARPLAAPPGV